MRVLGRRSTVTKHGKTVMMKVAFHVTPERGRDTLGVNVEATADLAFALTTPVIASGGVASLADLKSLKEVEKTGVEGVICGRALYDGRLDPAAALKLLAEPV